MEKVLLLISNILKITEKFRTLFCPLRCLQIERTLGSLTTQKDQLYFVQISWRIVENLFCRYILVEMFIHYFLYINHQNCRYWLFTMQMPQSVYYVYWEANNFFEKSPILDLKDLNLCSNFKLDRVSMFL